MKEFIENLLGQTEEAAAIAAEYHRRMQEQALERAVVGAIRGENGRNEKAIRALLDEAAIGQSEDMEGAAREAVTALKREHGYLFQVPRVYAPGTGSPSGGDYSMQELGKLPFHEYRKYRRGV